MLILVVEDEALVGLVLVLALVRKGRDVLGPAGTATEALALAERTPPELALVDIDLRNGGDGVGVARALLGRHGSRRYSSPGRSAGPTPTGTRPGASSGSLTTRRWCCGPWRSSRICGSAARRDRSRGILNSSTVRREPPAGLPGEHNSARAPACRGRGRDRRRGSRPRVSDCWRTARHTPGPPSSMALALRPGATRSSPTTFAASHRIEKAAPCSLVRRQAVSISASSSRAGQYDVTVDRVISPGRTMTDGSVTIHLSTGSARLRLHFAPKDAARIVSGLAAAVAQAGRGSRDRAPRGAAAPRRPSPHRSGETVTGPLPPRGESRVGRACP